MKSDKYWVISYGGGKSCVPRLLSDLNVKQDYPELKFEHDGKPFSVEFKNRSDYMAARDSSKEASVTVISGNRTKRVSGIAVNKKVF